MRCSIWIKISTSIIWILYIGVSLLYFDYIRIPFVENHTNVTAIAERKYCCYQSKFRLPWCLKALLWRTSKYFQLLQSKHESFEMLYKYKYYLSWIINSKQKNTTCGCLIYKPGKLNKKGQNSFLGCDRGCILVCC